MINVQSSSRFRNGANCPKRYLEHEPEATSIEGRKQCNGSCRSSKTCVSSTASLHRTCASLYVVFSPISICQSIISFLSHIYDFNGKSEEVTDNKTFPSKQHLLLTSYVGELQSVKIPTCFSLFTLDLVVFPAPLPSSSSVGGW